MRTVTAWMAAETANVSFESHSRLLECCAVRRDVSFSRNANRFGIVHYSRFNDIDAKFWSVSASAASVYGQDRYPCPCGSVRYRGCTSGSG